MIAVHGIKRIRRPHRMDTKAYSRELKEKQRAAVERLKREVEQKSGKKT